MLNGADFFSCVNFHVYYSWPFPLSNLTFFLLFVYDWLMQWHCRKCHWKVVMFQNHLIGHCQFKRWEKIGNSAHTKSTGQINSSPISRHVQLHRGKIMRIIQAMLWRKNNINLRKHFQSSLSSAIFTTLYHDYYFKDYLFCEDLGSVTIETVSSSLSCL